MKCVICSLTIHPSDYDIGNAFNAINPVTFRKADMHSDCFQDAIETAQETPSKKAGFQNRYDEYLTTKV